MINSLINTKDFTNILDKIKDGIYIVDDSRKIIFWNKAAEDITGFSKEDAINSFCHDNLLQHIDDDGNKLCCSGCPVHATIADGEERSAQVYLSHKSGYRVGVNLKTAPIINENKIVGAYEIFSDCENDRTTEENMNELKTIAFKDSLTQTYNRRYMQGYLDHRVKEYNNFETPFGLLFLDIDNFKNINDTYGHNTGDEVLKMLAKTSKSILRTTDILSRWGGEEFIILMPGVEYNELEKSAEKLRTIIQHSSVLSKEERISVTVSIGATLINDNDDSESFVDRADKLMYMSKINGKNRVTIK